MTTNEVKLEPCPACHELAAQIESSLVFPVLYEKGVFERGWRVRCEACAIQTCWWHSEVEAVNHWNHRRREETVSVREDLKSYRFRIGTTGSVFSGMVKEGDPGHPGLRLGESEWYSAKEVEEYIGRRPLPSAPLPGEVEEALEYVDTVELNFPKTAWSRADEVNAILARHIRTLQPLQGVREGLELGVEQYVDTHGHHEPFSAACDNDRGDRETEPRLNACAYCAMRAALASLPTPAENKEGV